MGRRRDRTGDAPAVEPLDVDGVRTVAIITVLWAVAFVVLAFQRAALNEAELGWWLWTCLAGVGLGLIGLEYCRKRREAIALADLQQEADAGLDEDEWTAASAVDDAAAAEPVPTDEVPADPYQEPYPTAAPLPERPVHAQPTEQFGYATGDNLRPVHQDSDQFQYREGRPPPGYVTGDLPVVPSAPHPPPGEPPPREPPAVEPAPAEPSPTGSQWRDQLWPRPPEAPEPGAPQGTSEQGLPYQPASPAGYSPEPDLARRHPRDTEMARRQEDEFDHPAGPTGHSPPVEFLKDEPDPAATAPQTRPPDIAPELLAAEPEAPPPGHDMLGRPPPTEPQQVPAQPEEQPPAVPDLVSEFFSDLPAGGGTSGPSEHADGEDPDVLLSDEPPAPGRRARRDPRPGSSSPTGEYRGRRARRD